MSEASRLLQEGLQLLDDRTREVDTLVRRAEDRARQITEEARERALEITAEAESQRARLEEQVAALRTDVEKIIASQKLPDGLRYAAIIPTYSGGCAGIFRFVVKPGVFTKAPILFLHGDADDYTPIGACQDYADKIGKAGTPVEFVVLKGAYHKFDGDDQKRYYLRGAQRTKAECVLEVDIDTGYVHDRTTGTRLRDEAMKTAQEACRATGANVEGNAGARALAATAAIGFLKKTFAN
jgi:hypothetical protein